MPFSFVLLYSFVVPGIFGVVVFEDDRVRQPPSRFPLPISGNPMQVSVPPSHPDGIVPNRLGVVLVI